MWQQIKNVFHFFVAIMANVWYGFPGRKLTVIGVTGTDGKTTTVNLIFHILQSANRDVSMVSTVGANVNGSMSLLNFHVTTPSPFTIQSFLRKVKKRGDSASFVVLEVSSHAIDQFRIWGIPFALGVVTNVTPEHLDYHKTYDNYLNTKAKLLQRSRTAIVNKDDASYAKLLPLLDDVQVVTYSRKTNADVVEQHFSYTTHLLGEFNKENILAAIAVCKTVGLTDAQIRKGIASFEAPIGRMNSIPNKKGIRIVVDYAHTPNGLEKALIALGHEKQKGKIIALIGAEGARDPGKREKLGEIAARLADVTVITAVDPRGKEKEINSAVLEGAKKAKGIVGNNVYVIADRKKAIEEAITHLAKKGDTVVLFGKGHERSMNYDGKHEVPWSDFAAVEEALGKQL